jgi:type I restriction enzyme S subunit
MVSSTGHGNAALKRLHYQEGQFALGSILCAVLPISEGLITARFIFEYLSAFKDELLVSRMTGTANVTLTIGRIGEIPIPIIPVDIQRAVDGLMRLCDRLEAAQLERESRRVRLTAATHHKLNNGVDADALRCNAQFLVGNLPTLTTTADQIKQLRQTILSLAVRGQLSATSLPKDQTMTLGDVAALQNGYAFKSEWFVGSGVRLLRNANVSHGVIRWDDVARLPEKQASEFERFRLKEGDIVLSLDRPFIVTGTKVARVRSVDLPCLLLQRVGRFEVDPVRLCSNYLFIWLRSQAFSGQVDAGRSNGVPHISSKQVESAKLWLPSLTEQQHIVAKVDELMTLCDQLEARLSTAQAEASQLLESVVHNALIGPAEPHPWQSSA